MNKPRFYLLALWAMQSDLQWEPARGEDFSRHHVREASHMPPVTLWALGVVASSEEEARETGMQALLRECPPEEGWINHIVAVNTISPETFQRIVNDVS